MNLHPFVQKLSTLRFENTFNPYSDNCDVHDRPHAAQSRAKALSRILESAQAGSIDAIWIGRDLGHRGGRRTGLALTDDINIARHTRRWDFEAERPTVGAAVAERTAAVIWSVLDQITTNVFLWNVFPLHPHNENTPFSNRQHNSKEREAGQEILQTLIQLLLPTRILALGNDAAVAAARVTRNVPVFCIRHPSYGGQGKFFAQIADLYGVRPGGERLL